jgi:SPP1 gp7 family putative phage head morphogenesis protein
MSTSADIFVRHQVYLEGLKSTIIKESDPFFSSLERLITQSILDAGVDNLNELTGLELESLIQQITLAEKALFGDYATQLTEKLKSAAEYEAQFAAAALNAAIVDGSVVEGTFAAAWLYAKTSPVQATGKLLEDFITTWTARDISAVEAVLRNAHAQGWTMQQAISAIRGTKSRNYRDGLIDKIESDISTLVRTSIQHVSNTARMATYEANKDIIQGYRWVSTLDSRTTAICRSLDGRVFELGVGPMPPIHPNCRSITVPEIVGSIELRKSILRSSKDGPVPASMTYYEWLKTQPASFQDAVLGKTRGKLLRDGGLTSEEFARLNLGRTFKPRTLEEMRSAWPEIFQHAGL